MAASELFVRPLALSHARAAATLVLKHFGSDPGYTYVWGESATENREELIALYQGKLGLLIAEEGVDTVGCFDKDDSLLGFAASNQRDYTKSWWLYLHQRFSIVRRSLPSPSTLLPFLLTTPSAVPGDAGAARQVRQRRIAAFRNELWPTRPTAEEGGQIWLMHIAASPSRPQAMDILLQHVVDQADEQKTAVELQMIHDHERVRWAKGFGFEVVGHGRFAPDNSSEGIECWAVRRPASSM